MSIQQTRDGVSRKQTDHYEKSVAYLEKDDEQQIAYGAVMVPDELDLQGDFIRADAIDGTAGGFTERAETGDALLGVMHAVFPGDGHVTLDDSRVLNSAETLGDGDDAGEYPAGTWVQAHKYHDNDLWELVSDGVISGFSIGGTIEEEIWYSPGAAPEDITIPDAVVDQLNEYDLGPDEVDVREIVDLRTLEVSSVDYPAVPRATHAAHKSAGLAKAAPALTESVVDARLYLEDRGHDEEAARRVAEYLDRAKTASDHRDSGSWIARARRFFSRGIDAPDKHSNRTKGAESPVGAMLETMDEAELSETLKTIREQNDDLSERVEALSEEVGKNHDDDPDDPDDPDGGTKAATEGQIEDLAAGLKTLGENQAQILGRVETMAEAGGFSQQKSDPNGGEPDGPSAAAKALGLGNMAGGD